MTFASHAWCYGNCSTPSNEIAYLLVKSYNTLYFLCGAPPHSMQGVRISIYYAIFFLMKYNFKQDTCLVQSISVFPISKNVSKKVFQFFVFPKSKNKFSSFLDFELCCSETLNLEDLVRFPAWEIKILSFLPLFSNFKGL